MMCPVTYSQVAACTIIILQIWSVTALTTKNGSTQIIACKDETVHLKWEYELNLNEYVDAKIWSYTKNEETILIAQWTYKDGPILEPNFINTVTIIGNDSLSIKNIATKDGGTYTLTLFVRQSSQPTTKLSLNLTVLQPPLTGCCKPTIQQLQNGTGLRANLESQGCGTGPFQLKWNNASGAMSNGDVLIFLASNLTGRFTVCVTGLSIEKCFNGKRESLCQEEKIEEIKKIPQTTEQNIALIAGLSVVCTIIVPTVFLAILIKVNWRRIKTYRSRNKKWEAVRENLKCEDDDTLFESLMQIQEVQMDRATMEISNIMYVNFKIRGEFALEEINATDSGDGGTLMENRPSNLLYAKMFYIEDKLLTPQVVQDKLGTENVLWCRKLVSTWCTAYENQYLGIPIRTNDENIQTMKSFPILFVLSLKNAEKGQTLASIIQKQFVMGSVFRKGLFDINLDLLMSERPDKIMFIINDVDEADADVEILKEIVSQTKNSLTILLCSDWETYKSKCGIDLEMNVSINTFGQ